MVLEEREELRARVQAARLVRQHREQVAAAALVRAAAPHRRVVALRQLPQPHRGLAVLVAVVPDDAAAVGVLLDRNVRDPMRPAADPEQRRQQPRDAVADREHSQRPLSVMAAPLQLLHDWAQPPHDVAHLEALPELVAPYPLGACRRRPALARAAPGRRRAMQPGLDVRSPGMEPAA